MTKFGVVTDIKFCILRTYCDMGREAWNKLEDDDDDDDDGEKRVSRGQPRPQPKGRGPNVPMIWNPYLRPHGLT